MTAIDLLSDETLADPTLTDIYEFGVYTGGSLGVIRTLWEQNHLALGRVWAFDSFVGLQKGAAIPGESTSWHDGYFSAADALGINSLTELKHRLLQKITGKRSIAEAKQDWFGKKLTFIAGYFNESLRPGLVQTWQMKPARYVDIDVDQYLPAVQVLDWMFSQGLIRVGTYIFYDDIGSTPEKWVAGEAKAHLEMASKYGVRFRLVYNSCIRHLSGPPLQRGNDHPECPQLARCRTGYVLAFRVESIDGGQTRGRLC